MSERPVDRRPAMFFFWTSTSLVALRSLTETLFSLATTPS